MLFWVLQTRQDWQLLLAPTDISAKSWTRTAIKESGRRSGSFHFTHHVSMVVHHKSLNRRRLWKGQPQGLAQRLKAEGRVGLARFMSTIKCTTGCAVIQFANSGSKWSRNEAERLHKVTTAVQIMKAVRESWKWQKSMRLDKTGLPLDKTKGYRKLA